MKKKYDTLWHLSPDHPLGGQIFDQEDRHVADFVIQADKTRPRQLLIHEARARAQLAVCAPELRDALVAVTMELNGYVQSAGVNAEPEDRAAVHQARAVLDRTPSWTEFSLMNPQPDPLRSACEEVLACWESGDLAGAVRKLGQELAKAKKGGAS